MYLLCGQAIQAEPDNVDYLLKRSMAYSKLKNTAAAAEDASKAAEKAPENAQAHFRDGVLKFELESFKAAMAAFTLAKSLTTEEKLLKSIGTWTRKCEAELSEDEIQLMADPVAKKEAPAAPTAPKPSTAFPMDWYQSLSHVTIEIESKGIPKEKVKHEITPTSVSVDIELESADQTYSFHWETFGEVDPAGSKVEVGKRYIEIRLKKVDTSISWPSLEATSGSAPQVVTATPAPVPSAPAAAPSAYASKKNWDAIYKEIEETEAAEKPEGEEALNKLFKDIYKNASDDTRRAMIKSFQTSGGTVLSTNWNEVAEKDYEKDRPAPKGMQWKSWEGDKLDVGEDDE